MRDVKRLNVGSGLEGSTQLSHGFPCSTWGAQKLPGAQLCVPTGSALYRSVAPLTVLVKFFVSGGMGETE